MCSKFTVNELVRWYLFGILVDWQKSEGLQRHLLHRGFPDPSRVITCVPVHGLLSLMSLSHSSQSLVSPSTVNHHSCPCPWFIITRVPVHGSPSSCPLSTVHRHSFPRPRFTVTRVPVHVHRHLCPCPRFTVSNDLFPIVTFFWSINENDFFLISQIWDKVNPHP